MNWDDPAQLQAFVRRLTSFDHELEWLEFKENFNDPEGIGEYLSSLANSATLASQEASYMVWGISDQAHEIVGTTFDPWSQKQGNEDLIPWLSRLLSPAVTFKFRKLELQGKTVVILRVDAATTNPVKFKNVAFIRSGSYKKRLSREPALERQLWDRLQSFRFEDGIAQAGLEEGQVLQLLDYEAYFDLHDVPSPTNETQVLEVLAADRLVRYDVERQWQVLNGGALLYARDLTEFAHLARKSPRVVIYRDSTRVTALREHGGIRGYASGFTALMSYINDQLPSSEFISAEGIRKDELMFPRLAVRELVANALIHQDLTMTGAGPLIEIFPDRMEITNPGVPLVDPQRFIDLPPISRNEFLGASMRQIGIAEERGSGWDKIAFEVEYHQLPAPLIQVTDRHTRVTLFAPKPLAEMDRGERCLATYQHACLRHVSNLHTNNSSIRERFGIEDKNKAQASRILREAVEEGLITPHDPTAGPRRIRYVPFWAAPTIVEP